MSNVTLPHDHGSHAECAMEWWYSAGCLESATGTTYSYFATIWSTVIGVARFHLVDLATGRTELSLSRVEQVTSGARQGPLDVAVGDHAYRWRPSGPHGTFTFIAATPDGEVQLDMTPTRPYTLHGRDGIIEQGAGGPSAYYSATRLQTELRWSHGGAARTLKGSGWFDHQWGDFVTTPTALRWDWFACSLTSGEDLMVYRFLDLANRPASGHLVATHVDARGEVRHLDDRHVRVSEDGWVVDRPDLGAEFPMRWRIEVPSEGLDIALEAVSERQFVDMGPPGTIFEGVADIRRGARGRCYVESSRLIGRA